MHENIEQTKSVIQGWIEEYNNYSYNWIVELKGTKEVIGSIGAVKYLQHSGSVAQLLYMS
jgi:hypothetical protein